LTLNPVFCSIATQPPGLTVFGACKIIKVFPGVGNLFLCWQPPLIAAFTWSMGQVLKIYFPLIKEGKTWDKQEMQLAMEEAWQRAKAIDWKKELLNSVSFNH
jgi:uncharacterized protein (DUF697 family)